MSAFWDSTGVEYIWENIDLTTFEEGRGEGNKPNNRQKPKEMHIRTK